MLLMHLRINVAMVYQVKVGIILKLLMEEKFRKYADSRQW